jgi:hypothetical protein
MKLIPGFPDYIAYEDGRIYSKKTNKFMTACNGSYGYKLVCVRKNGKASTQKVHRLIASAFLPNPENKAQVNHKNGIKSDNRLENLEWATQSENQLHAYRTGLKDDFVKRLISMSKEVNSKLVLDLETGIFFDSAIEAAKAKCIRYKTLVGYLCGFRKNKTSLIYA